MPLIAASEACLDAKERTFWHFDGGFLASNTSFPDEATYGQPPERFY
jgi:hypothetical protein